MAENETIDLPVIPMRSQVVFPNTTGAFDVGRRISVAAVDRADKSDFCVFITRQLHSDDDSPSADDICMVGTVARIKQMTRLPGSQIRVYYSGLYRARITYMAYENEALIAQVERLSTDFGDCDPVLLEAHLKVAKESARTYAETSGKARKEIETAIDTIDNCDTFVNICAHHAGLSADQKQALLEETVAT